MSTLLIVVLLILLPGGRVHQPGGTSDRRAASNVQV
jgi:hypothetical protein